VQAYPYYFSTWATIAGFIVFIALFLVHDERNKGSNNGIGGADVASTTVQNESKKN
jgi:hypothetical protein